MCQCPCKEPTWEEFRAMPFLGIGVIFLGIGVLLEVEAYFMRGSLPEDYSFLLAGGIALATFAAAWLVLSGLRWYHTRGH